MPLRNWVEYRNQFDQTSLWPFPQSFSHLFCHLPFWCHVKKHTKQMKKRKGRKRERRYKVMRQPPTPHAGKRRKKNEKSERKEHFLSDTRKFRERRRRRRKGSSRNKTSFLNMDCSSISVQSNIFHKFRSKSTTSFSRKEPKLAFRVVFVELFINTSKWLKLANMYKWGIRIMILSDKVWINLPIHIHSQVQIHLMYIHEY